MRVRRVANRHVINFLCEQCAKATLVFGVVLFVACIGPVALGQSPTPTSNPAPASVVRIPPPPRQVPSPNSKSESKPVVAIPPPPKTAALPTVPRQDFLEDLDPRSTKDELLPPVEQKRSTKPDNDEDLLTPLPSEKFRVQDLLEEREKPVTPYPKPNFDGQQRK